MRQRVYMLMVAVIIAAFALTALINASSIVSQPGGQLGEPANAGFAYDSADVNQDRVISTEELSLAIAKYYEGSYAETELNQTIDRWANGEY